MEKKISKKIQPINRLAKTIERIKKNGNKVVHCHGVFDLVHLGHIRYFNQAKKEDKSIAGYGVPAKGNTLLNYCGIRTDFFDYTVDRNPHKQGLYLPVTG